MISLSPFPSVTSTPKSLSEGGATNTVDKRLLSIYRRSPSRVGSRSSLCSHPRRFQRRPKLRERDLSESGVVIEEIPSGILPSISSSESSTKASNINGDLSSSFIVVGKEVLECESVVRCKIPKGTMDTPLHRPKNAEHVLRLLESGYDPNQPDLSHDAQTPIHTIVRSKLKDRAACLEVLLVHSNVDVNICDAHKMTALHFAAMIGDLRCVKLLLAFGADINAISDFDQTPMNLALAHYQENVIHLLGALEGVSATFVQPAIPIPLPGVTQLRSLQLPLNSDSSDNELERASRFMGSYDLAMDSIRPFYVNLQLETQASFVLKEEEAVSLILRQQETSLLHRSQSEIMHTLTFRIHNGCRILCLDGLGIRGLVIIEVLEHFEKLTGQKITEIFDIICGSSIGGLIALGLVYGKKSLSQLRQILYKMKENIYSNSHSEPVYNTELLNALLQDTVDTTLTMCDVKEPKVMVCAVNKITSDLKLHFFSNFLDDEFCHESVFQVAQYITSTPTLYTDCNNYIDACIIANNPCDYALTRLQQYYFMRREQQPVSLVVSVGTGIYSHAKMGDLPRIMSPGKQRTRSREAWHRLENFIILMKNSIVQSEEVARSCKSRCEQLGIPFYRFNPELRETVSAFETDSRKLLNMVLRTRLELQNMCYGIETLRQYCREVVDSYTASGSGLGVVLVSDVMSPSELIPQPTSSDTTSSGDELQKLRLKNFMSTRCCSPTRPITSPPY